MLDSGTNEGMKQGKTFFEEEDEKEVLRSVCIHFDMTR